jgi:hypothetical protein
MPEERIPKLIMKWIPQEKRNRGPRKTWIGIQAAMTTRNWEQDQWRKRDGWMDGWVDGWMGGWMDGWMGGWMGGWMDGWVDRWMEGWRGDRQLNVKLAVRIVITKLAVHLVTTKLAVHLVTTGLYRLTIQTKYTQ